MEEVGAVRFEKPAASNSTVRARGLRLRMTYAEQKLWCELRKLDANFRRQAPVGRYFADFASHGHAVIVEVDGGIHERLDEVVLRDFERQQWLESQGYRVLRFTNDEVVGDVWACVDVVRQALGGSASEPTGDIAFTAAATPPSPALPPSRRKGA